MQRACRCGGRISGGVCDRCGPPRDVRPSSSERGYGAEWKHAKDRHLRQQPLCVCCVAQGKVTGARGRNGLLVDHIVPQRLAPERFWDRTNWQTLCLDCDLRHKKPLELRCSTPEQVQERWAELLASLAANCPLDDRSLQGGGGV